MERSPLRGAFCYPFWLWYALQVALRYVEVPPVGKFPQSGWSMLWWMISGSIQCWMKHWQQWQCFRDLTDPELFFLRIPPRSALSDLKARISTGCNCYFFLYLFRTFNQAFFICKAAALSFSTTDSGWACWSCPIFLFSQNPEQLNVFQREPADLPSVPNQNGFPKTSGTHFTSPLLQSLFSGGSRLTGAFTHTTTTTTSPSSPALTGDAVLSENRFICHPLVHVFPPCLRSTN